MLEAMPDGMPKTQTLDLIEGVSHQDVQMFNSTQLRQRVCIRSNRISSYAENIFRYSNLMSMTLEAWTLPQAAEMLELDVTSLARSKRMEHRLQVVVYF